MIRDAWKKTENNSKASVLEYTFETLLRVPLHGFSILGGVLLLEIASTGIDSSRSGYEAAENFQKGAVSPIFSLLKAIYKFHPLHELAYQYQKVVGHYDIAVKIPCMTGNHGKFAFGRL